jgi:outer membrane receptor protein involved in Fe transport
MRGSLKACGSAVAMMAVLAGSETAHSQEFDGLEEIFVTAQRRTENLQEVPITVNTLSNEALRNIFAAGEDVRALSARVPSLNIESSNGRLAPRFYIRGLGNTDFDLAASQPVSVIVDEVVLENVLLKSTPLFDVDRVEVLKGPQGTLFGRNTPAGIVKFDTRRPTFEEEGYGTLAYGNRNTVTAEGAFSGALVEDVLAMRVSGLLQRRDDFIDNAFTGEDDALGGYTEFAGRVQLLYKPNEKFEALARAHFRDFNGTSAIFRANIFEPGTNNLVSNFDRETVFFNGGGNNPAEAQGWGANLNLSYDFGSVTLTSISAIETGSNSSRGDIDGGFVDENGVTGPGLIFFQSDTRDGLDDLQQITQEIRLASNESDSPLSWQVGFFYFDSDLTIETDPVFTIQQVTHTNQSWAVFGQAAYAFTDELIFTAGLRYTEDDKDFTAAGLPASFDREVSDEKLTWDFALAYQAADNVNLFVRHARGFRAPTIQGRDVVFGAPPSTADSETVMSYEVGAKTEFLDNRLRLNVAAFYYVLKDQQLTAAGGDFTNTIRLLNAEKGVGYGFEADATFAFSEYLTGTLGFAWTETEIQDDDLAVGTCAQCTTLDPLNAFGQALIDGNPFPQAPDYTVSLLVNYERPISDTGSVFMTTDWFVQGKTNFPLYESAEFNSSGTFEGGLRAGYRHNDGQYEVAAFARNITNENNLKGAIDFTANTGFLNEPRTFGIQFSASFN